MMRLLAAAVLALTATNPLLAQGKGNDQAREQSGKGGGKPEAGNDRGGGKAQGQRSGERDRGAEKAMRGGGDDRPDRSASAERGRSEDAARGRDARDAMVRADNRDDGRTRRDGWDDRDGWIDRERFYADVPSCPPGLAKKNNGCLPPGLARQDRDEIFGYAYSPALFGIPLRSSADYVYYDGYLIPSGGDGRYLPLLGGALAVGQMWPEAYPSLPLAPWQTGYYGFEDPNAYRYADNVIYRVDPATSAIEAVVALLTGSDFAVGQALPPGYDVYNVPAPYQDRYVDSDDALYRYADGRVYEVDPVTMLIEQAIDLIA